MRLQYLFALTLAIGVSAVPNLRAAPPTITLDQGTFTGNDSSIYHSFLGIPFAKPPVGDLRFRRPVPFGDYEGNFQANKYGFSCVAQNSSLGGLNSTFLGNSSLGGLLGGISAGAPESEDCLTINVVKPAGATAASNLPVLVWIYGGGFSMGSSSTYDGGLVVNRSIALGSPVVFISMNYRLSALGFPAGAEVKAAGVGNLGLYDQRVALHWIQKYIGKFGGDPTKVTIWGESAGAVSVGLHMVSYNGNHENLFRAGVMQSGAPIPTGDLTTGQKFWDTFVIDAGCASASDTLACLRTKPLATIKSAMDKAPSLFSYQATNLAFGPRSDGDILPEPPLKLVQQGKIARVPYITGNCDDEGTLFSFSTLNVTTELEFRSWVSNYFIPGISTTNLNQVALVYPPLLSAGSPFDTGLLNAITPQFKRIAALQGDAVFQAPRRWLQQNTVGKQNFWVFLHKKMKALPFLGAMHASDLQDSFFTGGALQDYIIRFADQLNPNSVSSAFQWPAYTSALPRNLVLSSGVVEQAIGLDNYRDDAMNTLISVSLQTAM